MEIAPINVQADGEVVWALSGTVNAHANAEFLDHYQYSVSLILSCP
jgi:hypothetical protein